MQRETAIAEDFWRETLHAIEEKKQREPNKYPIF
jgi:hypothetical protein